MTLLLLCLPPPARPPPRPRPLQNMGFTPAGSLWLTTKAGDLYYTQGSEDVEKFGQVRRARAFLSSPAQPSGQVGRRGGGAGGQAGGRVFGALVFPPGAGM